ncbi:hypothetical protein JVT61DRAFT_6748 [Boletus reticuloceps]|uniref:Uncharacterized protein n=1 Tax=Boletus reticuloceps TaxID=495285 RepID=A0A8I2YJR8_9AGAM|nr:hypothetical protein JVT61DRAFT_6748 [Boletus reticuloceps]
MADPNLEVHPNFASNAFHEVRGAVMDVLHIDMAQATERLKMAWDANHAQQIEEWNAQLTADALDAEHLQHEQGERDDEARRLEEADAEKECKEVEKKKPRISDFNTTLAPPNTIVPRPSQYAIQKIISFDYVELWYFSPDGCSEAELTHRSQADDAFGISNLNNVLTLRPVAALKASRNARVDHDLSFGEFLQAKNLSFIT